MSKYEAVYFVGDNQAINRVRVDSSKTRNRGAFSGSLAALLPYYSVLRYIFCFTNLPLSKQNLNLSVCSHNAGSTLPQSNCCFTACTIKIEMLS